MLPTSAGASPAAKPSSRARRADVRRSGLSLPLTLLLLALAALAGGFIGRRTAGTPAGALVPHAPARGGGAAGFGAHGAAALAVPGAGGRKLPKLFLFIGILSGRGYRHRRLAVREAWAGPAQLAPVSLCRFVLSEDEATAQVDREQAEYGDIIYIKERTNYKSILYKTYFIFEYAVENYDVNFVLKTDDDAFVNVPPSVSLLRSYCETPDCSAERLYVGRMIQESEVLLQPGHKWNNAVFYNHTGLRTYPKYAMGGGYVLSGDVARTLIAVNRAQRLKFTPIEDATLGFWLMAMDLRHVDHERFYTWAAACCFETLEHDDSDPAPPRVKVMDAVTEDLCSDTPWLVLHKIDSPTKMRALGAELRACGGGSVAAVAPSVATVVGAVPAAALAKAKALDADAFKAAGRAADGGEIGGRR